MIDETPSMRRETHLIDVLTKVDMVRLSMAEPSSILPIWIGRRER